MTHQPYEWISVSEASKRLNVSVSTIRRMIESGELVGEREPLGGSRERYRVRMPQETPQDASPPESEDEPPDASERTTEPSAAIMGLLEDLREMRQHQRDDASLIAELSSRLSRAETLVETLQGLRDQWAREANEQQEARIRAEAETERLRGQVEKLSRRRWWRPSTW